MTYSLLIQWFIGQVMGSSVGTRVFVQYGWRASASVSMAWYGLQLFVQLVRGPHVKRYTWFGYEGGLEARKSVVTAKEKAEADAADIQEKTGTQHDSSTPSGSDARIEKKDPSDYA